MMKELQLQNLKCAIQNQIDRCNVYIKNYGRKPFGLMNEFEIELEVMKRTAGLLGFRVATGYEGDYVVLKNIYECPEMMYSYQAESAYFKGEVK